MQSLTRAAGLNRGPWTEEEEATLLRHHTELGNRWSEIARRMGRSENTVKNHWYAGTKKYAGKKRSGSECAAPRA